MVATNENLLSKCAGEGCGGNIGIGTGIRYRCGNSRNRAPATRNTRNHFWSACLTRAARL